MQKKLPLKKLWLCSVPALCLSAALTAQTPGGAPGGAPGQQQPGMPTQPSAGQMTAPGATEPNMAPTPESYGDRAFISKAMQGGMAEVELGQLAQQKSQSQDVKQFAQKMVNDHQQMGDKWLKPVAKQMGISDPKGPAKKEKKLMEKLQGLSGNDFDTAYIQAMVKDHKEDLKDFKSQAESSQNPNVKQIAEQGSQIIQKHLDLIEQIAQAHNVPVDGKAGEMSSNK